MKAIEHLVAHMRRRALELKEFKEKGSKIIGYVPRGYVPEELLAASGAPAVGLIRGGDHEPVVASEACTFRFVDTFCRSHIGYRILGEEILYQLPDLLVVPITDRNITCIADMWQRYPSIHES